MGTRYKGTKDETRALCAFINLARAADSLSSRLTPHLSAAGLTESQFGILEALLHLGPMCQASLGQKILRSGGNITFVVDNLEKRGLVRRERQEEDRRFVTVKLTEKGKSLIEGLFPKHAGSIVKEMDALSAGEQEDLRRLCRKLGKGDGKC